MDNSELALYEILPSLLALHLNRCLLRLCYKPGIHLGSEDTAVNKIAFPPSGLTFLMGEPPNVSGGGSAVGKSKTWGRGEEGVEAWEEREMAVS